MFVNGAEPDPLYKCNMYESLVRTRLSLVGFLDKYIISEALASYFGILPP